MREYIIITDSTCDLKKEQSDKLSVKVLPVDFTLDNGMDLNGERFDSKKFYDLLREGVTATTTQINFSTFEEAFESYLRKNMDVLYISFSSQLSNTYSSACLAARELKSKYPDGKVIVKDSLCACMGEGLLVYYAAQKKLEGLEIEELSSWIDENKLNICHLFTVDDLNFLKKGGRISATTAILGSMLNVKPVLHVSEGGRLEPIDKVRGRKAALMNIVKRVKEQYDKTLGGTVFIAQADCLDEANFLKDEIKKSIGVEDIVMNTMGPVIGAHAGPGTIAVFFAGKQR